MVAFIDKIQFLGEDAIKAGNDYLEFKVVPSWGSNLISIVEKETNTELLRTPATLEEYLEVPMLYGTPILFPPNRIDKGAFTYNGHSYQFDVNEVNRQNHSHGFVHDKNWELIKAEVSGETVEVVTEFDSSKFPDVIRQFPHHFILRMSYHLDGHVLSKNAEVINKSGNTLPLGLGYHTTFFFPENLAKLSVHADKRWVLNERMLPTGELEEIPFANELKNGSSFNEIDLDDAFLAAHNEEGLQQAKLVYTSLGLEVLYNTDENFTQWVVFNMGGHHGFICPEPYTWVTNAPNLELPASLTGLQGLEPNESKLFKTSIHVWIKGDK